MSTRKGSDYDLKDPKLVEYLDKNHAELRFAKFSPDIGEFVPFHLLFKTRQERLNLGVLIFASLSFSTWSCIAGNIL